MLQCSGKEKRYHGSAADYLVNNTKRENISQIKEVSDCQQVKLKFFLIKIKRYLIQSNQRLTFFFMIPKNSVWAWRVKASDQLVDSKVHVKAVFSQTKPRFWAVTRGKISYWHKSCLVTRVSWTYRFQRSLHTIFHLLKNSGFIHREILEASFGFFRRKHFPEGFLSEALSCTLWAHEPVMKSLV